MNRGPMSRLTKVPVKCKTCGRIKYNVVCNNEEIEEKKEEKPQQQLTETKKAEENQAKEKVYKKPKEYNYIKSVVKKQNIIVNNAYKRDDE